MSEHHAPSAQSIPSGCVTDCPYQDKLNAVYDAIFVSNGEPSIKERLRQGNDKMDALAVRLDRMITEKEQGEKDSRKMWGGIAASVLGTLIAGTLIFGAGMVWASKADTSKTVTTTTSSHP